MLLGEVQGFLNVGEAARYLFEAGMQARGIPCGCGKPVSACEFWKDMLPIIPPDLPQIGARLIRIRRFPSISSRSGGRGLSPDEKRILSSMEQVYKQVRRQTGCEVIVDSSKDPSTGLMISLIPEVELHVLHLVREPSNVVASWTSKKGYLRTHSFLNSIRYWWSYNVFSEKLREHAKSYTRIRFEDFVREPEEFLREITTTVMGRPIPTPFLHGNEAVVQIQHHLAGNPDKLSTGSLTIGGRAAKPTSPLRRLIVNFLTFPLQYRYGYLPSKSSLSGSE